MEKIPYPPAPLYVVHIRYSNGRWEKKVPQSGHPVWSKWHPVPPIYKTIEEFINDIRTRENRVVCLDDLSSEE